LKINKHYIYACVAILLWGFSSLSILIINEYWEGIQSLAFTFLLAAVFLFFVTLKRGRLNELKTYTGHDFAVIFGMGFIGVFLYNVLNTYSYMFATGTEALAINYLWPIWTVVFSMIILKEKITTRKVLAVALSFTGMLLVVTRGDLDALRNANVYGVSQAFLCSVCYGLFSAVSKKARYDKITASMLYFAASALIAIICMFVFSSPPPFTADGVFWSMMLLRGVGQFGVGYAVWTLAIMGDTVKISNMVLVTPFIQLLTLAAFTGEPIGFAPFAGLACIVFGALAAGLASGDAARA